MLQLSTSRPPHPRPVQVARLFSGNQPSKKAGIGPIRRKSEGPDKGDQLVVHALRLVENTDRFSSDMRALEKGAGAGTYCSCSILFLFVLMHAAVEVLRVFFSETGSSSLKLYRFVTRQRGFLSKIKVL